MKNQLCDDEHSMPLPNWIHSIKLRRFVYPKPVCAIQLEQILLKDEAKWVTQRGRVHHATSYRTTVSDISETDLSNKVHKEQRIQQAMTRGVATN